MPYIGNDIVDLKDPVNLQKSLDLRFQKKILTNAEIEFVHKARNPNQALWSFWASKETAYKVIKKIYPDSSFLPRQWEVCLNPPARCYTDGIVAVSKTDQVNIRLFYKRGYLHCIGTDSYATLENIIHDELSLTVSGKRENQDGSLFLRDLLARKLADNFQLNFSDIRIKRDKINGELQPPYVLAGDERLAVDISLSHDGNFVAYALLL